MQWLHTDGRFLNDEEGNARILRGVSIADPKSLMFHKRERPYDLFQIIDMAVKEWHCGVIRLPIHPGGIDDVPGWEDDIVKYTEKYIQPVVQKAVDLNIYIIIDLHIFGNYIEKIADEQIRNFWKVAAPAYKNVPNVLFEIFNEPVKPDIWDAWKDTAQPWIDFVRFFASKNIIIAGGPRWCQNMSGAAKNPFNGENIVYSAHCYPHHFQYFEENWGPLFENFHIFFTEWGYEKPSKIASGTIEGTTSEFGIPFKKIIESKGSSWVAWCFDNDWSPKIFNKPWVIPDDRENRMGHFVKSWLIENDRNY